jgi:hypothetical protein
VNEDEWDFGYPRMLADGHLRSTCTASYPVSILVPL